MGVRTRIEKNTKYEEDNRRIPGEERSGRNTQRRERRYEEDAIISARAEMGKSRASSQPRILEVRILKVDLDCSIRARMWVFHPQVGNRAKNFLRQGGKRRALFLRDKQPSGRRETGADVDHPSKTLERKEKRRRLYVAKQRVRGETNVLIRKKGQGPKRKNRTSNNRGREREEGSTRVTAPVRARMYR